MSDESRANGRAFERQYYLKIILRIYFIILFIASVVGLSFNRQIGALLIFVLVVSLIVFICCNCNQCYKTRVISGQVLMSPPDMTIGPPGLQSSGDQQIAYIIVAPSGPQPGAEDSAAPLYPPYPTNHFPPPPTYEESQRLYK